ncbi:unnamed protein product [Brassica rapa]|uniref:Uncharacterized protein n=1 Tax=Brassica campestris TaxID=3711 RepID=A0A8D9M2W6_BRACM|nr:unnamed protein product [Brassica rapa]
MHLRNSIECSLIVLINSRIRTSFIKSKRILLILARQETIRNGGYRRFKSHLMVSPTYHEGCYRAERNVLIKLDLLVAFSCSRP